LTRYFVIDLFTGSGSWSKPWRTVAERIWTLDLLPEFDPDICIDIKEVDEELVASITRCIPEDAVVVVYASPPCTCFSVASLSTHWDKSDGTFRPKSEGATDALLVIESMIRVIETIDPDYLWVENPRGVLRKLGILPPEWSHAEVWYCKYGDERAKPTDLWGIWPESWEPRPKCRNGASLKGECHHAPAPRGATTGTQGRKGWLARSQIPVDLVLDTKEAVMDGDVHG